MTEGPGRPHGDGDLAVALTFDDGPDPRVTDRILEILADWRVPATFFVVGRRIRRRESLVERALAAGHEIGNHSYSHRPLVFRSGDLVSRELEKTSRLIAQIAGRAPAWFRPPYGLHDRVVRETARKLQLGVAGWTLDALDWMRLWGPDRISGRVLGRLGRREIVLFHDRIPETARALPRILEELTRRKYRFCRVGELIQSENGGRSASLLTPRAVFPIEAKQTKNLREVPR